MLNPDRSRYGVLPRHQSPREFLWFRDPFKTSTPHLTSQSLAPSKLRTSVAHFRYEGTFGKQVGVGRGAQLMYVDGPRVAATAAPPRD